MSNCTEWILKSHSSKLLFVKLTHIYKYRVAVQLIYLDFLRLDCTALVKSLVELEAEAGLEDLLRCPFSTLSEATTDSSVREFLRLGVLDFSTISLGSLLCAESMAAFASISGLATDPCRTMAGVSFGTKFCEGAMLGRSSGWDPSFSSTRPLVSGSGAMPT